MVSFEKINLYEFTGVGNWKKDWLYVYYSCSQFLRPWIEHTNPLRERERELEEISSVENIKVFQKAKRWIVSRLYFVLGWEHW